MAAFRELQLPLSANQVSHVLATARQQRCNPSSSGSDHPGTLSWGEFCVFAVEIAARQRQAAERSVTTGNRGGAHPVGGGARGPTVTTRKGNGGAHRTDHGCHCEVFLGGSCNPTTWRKDTAIPVLQSEGITYYNPQVEEWYPELMEIEEQAKQAASVLLFVVDDKTRAVASMVEVAHLAGLGRELVLVVEDIRGENPQIAEDALSRREAEDLNRGRAFVRNLVEQENSVLTGSVTEAVGVATAMLHGAMDVAEYIARHRPHHVRHSHTLGEEMRLLRQVFVMYDTDRRGVLNMKEAQLALKSLRIQSPNIPQLFSGGSESQEHQTSWQRQGIPFEDFCALYAELKHLALLAVRPGLVFATFCLLGAPFRWISTWLWSTPPSPLPPPPFCDVFLGGSCGSTSWRRDIAIPILRQYGVSYFNPQLPNWDTRLIPIENQAKEQSRILLFVVSGDTLSVASMVEIAYYLGRGRKMVLCINDIPQSEDPEVDGMKLSQRALKDYNRGRTYLANIANKSRVPIFTNVSDTAMCAVYLLRGYRLPPVSTVPLSGTTV